MLSMLGNFFQQTTFWNICFSYFFQKIGFDISCKLSPMRQFAWNVKACFPGKLRKNIINFSSTELDQKFVKDNMCMSWAIMKKGLWCIGRQWRTRSSCIHAQSGQSIHCLLIEALDIIECTSWHTGWWKAWAWEAQDDMEAIAESGSSWQSTLMIAIPGDLVWDLPCVQQASYLEGGPLMWMLPLYLYVNQKSGPSCSKLTISLVNESHQMIRKYAEIFCWKNVSSFCSAKATHMFSAKNIRILYIESAKIVNEMTLNELIKLTMLWTTGPWLWYVMMTSSAKAFIRLCDFADWPWSSLFAYVPKTFFPTMQLI